MFLEMWLLFIKVTFINDKVLLKVMDLRELKREVDGLGDIDKNLRQMKSSWIKQIRKGSNQEFNFLNQLDDNSKKNLNDKLIVFNGLHKQLRRGQIVNEKLKTLAHYLVELKVASLSGDKRKPKILVRRFLSDEFTGLHSLVNEVKEFELNLNNLTDVYDEINLHLAGVLPLEHSVALLDSPHKNYLNKLKVISTKQKRFVKLVGKHFIFMAKSMKDRREL